MKPHGKIKGVHPLEEFTAFEFVGGDIRVICLLPHHNPRLDRVAVFTRGSCSSQTSQCPDIGETIRICERIVAEQRWIEDRRAARQFSRFDLCLHTKMKHATALAKDAMQSEFTVDSW